MDEQKKLDDEKPKTNAIAHELAKKQREVGIAEFFERNRHLLGFDNKRKALLTAVREGVDNALDACEEAGILPEIIVEIIQLKEDHYRVVVEDNGPGIVKKQIPKIFAKLLYGSKFFKLAQSLTADEPIIIKRSNKIEILPIGELIDTYIKKEEGERLAGDLNIEVPAFDTKTYSYKFRQVSHLIKHKRQNEIVKVTVGTNRNIKVTGCHSLFTYADGSVKEVEARQLKLGDNIIVPTKLPETGIIEEINILDYVTINDIQNNWFYVYGVSEQLLKTLKRSAKIIHKKTDKSRRYFRIGDVDILDDSFKQYEKKKFIPLKLVMQLGLTDSIKNGIIKTYYHGSETNLPITLLLSSNFVKFLGLFVAEGHIDKRQIGLTFGRHEDYLVKEVIDFLNSFGLNYQVEPRENSIRVKIFGNIFVKLIKNICGRGALNKHIPEFIFRANSQLRQDFLDYLYRGDGHNTKGRNQLMLTTVSSKLANEVMYLWMMQGVHASLQKRMNHGLGKKPTMCYNVNIYGKDIEKSNFFTCNTGTGSKRISQQLLCTDLTLLKVKSVEIINEGYDFVYDLSVPECENFVGGIGGISCHNTRGQQGIGISAAVMYGQLTTGRHAKILSKIHKNEPANYFELGIDTSKNAADISHESVKEWNKEHGTRIEIDLEATYQGGSQSVDEYLKETAITNPHATIIYTNPKAEQLIFPRAVDVLPQQPKEIKPHAYGVELGNMIKMLNTTETKTLHQFLTQEFTRIGDQSAKEICKNAGLLPNTKPQDMSREMAEQLVRGINNTKLMNPPTDCLSPITAELLEKGLRKEINAEFYCSTTRPVAVYRGNPFIIEAACALGGDQPAEEPVRIMRFANRVPLLYQQGACASSKAIIQTVWRNYGLSQSKGSIPIGPLTVVIHIASVWVPFTSESKEAIAHYNEIIKEMKLALQEVGRLLGGYLNKKQRIKAESKKRDYITIFIPHVGEALKELLGLKEADEKKIEENLKVILERTRGELEQVEEENLEYDEAFAKIGRKEKDEEED